MSSRKLNADILSVYNATELAQSGFVLGDRLATPQGIFVLSECSADLVRGQALVNYGDLFAVDVLTYSATAKTLTKASSAHGLTIAAGRLAGLYAFADDDDSDTGAIARIKTNEALASPGTVSITLDTVLKGADGLEATPGANLDITIRDPNYVKKGVGNTLLDIVIGVAPVNVDQSDRPYFWRQTHGLAFVLADGVITAGTPIVPSNATAGSSEALVDANQHQQAVFGKCVIPAPLADRLMLAQIDCNS